MIKKMSSIELYQDQTVRDLAWSCFGPPLIQDFSPLSASNQALESNFELSPQRRQWLADLDSNPAPLHQYLQSHKQRRLGLYFESLWHFFILHDPHLDLISHNLAVRNRHKTLGEFDLILFCQATERFIHLELAVKFYLQQQSSQRLKDVYQPYSRWLGPNSNDRFDIKLRRLLDHQTQLSQTTEGKHCLNELEIDTIAPQIALKGCLFYSQPQTLPEHEILASEHWRGRHYKLREIIEHINDNEHFSIVDKSQWLSPCFTQTDEGLLSPAQLYNHLEHHFQQQQRPLMIASMIDISQGFYETGRFFVTPDDWPKLRAS